MQVSHQFGVSQKELNELMSKRKEEGRQNLNELGGIQGLCVKLQTSGETGLKGDPVDIERRKELFGKNQIPPAPSKSFLSLVWEALQDTTLIILQVAALISLILFFYESHEEKPESVIKNEDEKYGWIEGVAILVSVFIVVLVTAFNDYAKEKQFQKLQNRIDDDHKFSVIRNSETIEILVHEIVVGDILQIKYGDLIPADGVLIQGNDLQIDESSFTGETDMMKKSDNDPMLLSGTHVMEGRGKILVTAVGINSQVGKIFSLLGVSGDQELPKPETKSSKNGDVETGQGTIEVTEAEAGQKESSTKKDKSILQRKLTKLAVKIGYFGFVVALITIAILVVQMVYSLLTDENSSHHEEWPQELVKFFIIGVTILVVAVPEGLPLAVTISLAYSVKKMMQDNNLVRHLDACETMGNATTICSDKTGTLTTNRMTVVKSFICENFVKSKQDVSGLPKDVLEKIAQGISVNTSYTSLVMAPKNANELPSVIGNKTDCALLNFVRENTDFDYNEIRKKMPEESLVYVYTFNSSRKSMSTVIKLDNGKYRMYTKGAFEIILNKCSHYIDVHGDINDIQHYNPTTSVGEEGESSVKGHAALSYDVYPMTADCLRLVLLAYKDFDTIDNIDWKQENEIIRDLTCLGIFGIEDPIRPEVPDAIKSCISAGITVRMLTGDNYDTARAIAKKAGILDQKEDPYVFDSKQLNDKIRDHNGVIQQDLLDKVWPKLLVLARSTPTDKYNLVEGIIKSKVNKNREIVAVTGDGTNDAPALKRADVGFAMGIAGTDVAKEASDIILTDDNFTSIVKAVMWGRNVYDSIAKFLQFQLTVNIVAVSVAFLGALVVKDSPLKAVQMLWVNLIMDSFASLALATELPTPELLNRKPYGRNSPLVSPIMFFNIVGQVIYQLAVVLCILFFGYRLLDVHKGGQTIIAIPSEHFTIIFNTFVLMTMFNEINARKIHGEVNVFKGIFTNPIFYVIWIGTCLAQVLIVTFGGFVFQTAALDLSQWLWCLFFGIGTLIWAQLTRVVYKHLHKNWKIKIARKMPVEEEVLEMSELREGRILWLRSFKRVQTQLNTVRAFNDILKEAKEKQSKASI